MWFLKIIAVCFLLFKLSFAVVPVLDDVTGGALTDRGVVESMDDLNDRIQIIVDNGFEFGSDVLNAATQYGERVEAGIAEK